MDSMWQIFTYFFRFLPCQVLTGHAGCLLQSRRVSGRWCCSAAGRGGSGSAWTRSSTTPSGSPSPSENSLHTTSRLTLSDSVLTAYLHSEVDCVCDIFLCIYYQIIRWILIIFNWLRRNLALNPASYLLQVPLLGAVGRGDMDRQRHTENHSGRRKPGKYQTHPFRFRIRSS